MIGFAIGLGGPPTRSMALVYDFMYTPDWIFPKKVDMVKSKQLILSIVQTDPGFNNPMSNVSVFCCNKPQYTRRQPLTGCLMQASRYF